MTNDEIINKKFVRAFTGYDICEVDAFLDEIVREMEKKDNEKNLLEVRLKMLSDEVNWLQARIRSLEDMIQ